MNNEYAFAIKVLNISSLKNPKSFSEMKKKGILPPQNYKFLNEEIIDWIEK